MLIEVAAAALICLDPGHGTLPAVGRQTEPVGPGSRVVKIKDGGGAPGEAAVALAIARRTRALLLGQGFRVAMTRTAAGYPGGNIARARFCNAHRAALMVRIHADGSTDPALHGVSTLFPAFVRGWTDDVYSRSLRAARLVEQEVAAATGAVSRGIVRRSDLTGFNWADVPVVLLEAGFMSNPAERARLQSASYQDRVARGLVAAVRRFVNSG